MRLATGRKRSAATVTDCLQIIAHRLESLASRRRDDGHIRGTPGSHDSGLRGPVSGSDGMFIIQYSADDVAAARSDGLVRRSKAGQSTTRGLWEA